mgnify:CR=1 FL=1
MVLVDGIERSISSVNPDEVESLSVLKDASATAVYGVKGANGVILIIQREVSKVSSSLVPDRICYSFQLGRA